MSNQETGYATVFDKELLDNNYSRCCMRDRSFCGSLRLCDAHDVITAAAAAAAVVSDTELKAPVIM